MESKFAQAKSEQAMKQVFGIKNEAARMKVTPPLAVASLAHGDDMRWITIYFFYQMSTDRLRDCGVTHMKHVL